MMEPTRNIDVVTGEIVAIRDNVQKVFFNGVIEIGRRLEEAKTLVPQGEWTEYLTGILGYKPSTAQNYMRIARELGDGQVMLDSKSAQELFGDLSYSQLLPLLALPDDQRREMAEENELADMSSREIEKLVRDLKDAKSSMEIANRRAEELAEQLEKAGKAQEAADEAEENAEAARVAAEQKAKTLEGRVSDLMAQLKQKPIEGTADLVPDEEILERERQKVRADMEEMVRRAKESEAEMAAKLKKAKNPALEKANFLFGELQHAISRMGDALNNLDAEQPDTAQKLRQVLKIKVPEMCEAI